MHLLHKRAIICCLIPLIIGCNYGPPSPEAEAYLNNALFLLEQKHINSSTADWPTIRIRAKQSIAGAEDPSDTYPAIRQALSTLGEQHSYLVEPHSVPDSSGGSAATTTSAVSLPRWRMVDSMIGLIELPELNSIRGGPEAAKNYTATLRSGLTELDENALCGWIIDLRKNSGGNMWPMLQGLDPLLGAAPFGHFLTADGTNMAWSRTSGGIGPLTASQEFEMVQESFDLTNKKAPLAILLGPRTASTGEMVAIAFIGRDAVQTFGLPTAGYTTANTFHRLSDGAFLVITETNVSDRGGKEYNGAIDPDHETSEEVAEAAAVEWLKSECHR